jgi:nicotinate-nucleotide adenylyltransferase
VPRIAFLGGSFDPPHVAHVLLATYALLRGEVDEVLVVPVYEHAFGKRLAGFSDRVAMCELAFQGLRGVRVTRVEEQLPRPNRTLRTLQHLVAEQPDASFRLIIGSDVLAEAAKWHAFDEVTRLAPPLVVSRPGHAQLGAALMPDVSSSQVRELLARRDEAALGKLAELVPRAVLDYVLEHDLYRAEG